MFTLKAFNSLVSRKNALNISSLLRSAFTGNQPNSCDVLFISHSNLLRRTYPVTSLSPNNTRNLIRFASKSLLFLLSCFPNQLKSFSTKPSPQFYCKSSYPIYSTLDFTISRAMLLLPTSVAFECGFNLSVFTKNYEILFVWFLRFLKSGSFELTPSLDWSSDPVYLFYLSLLTKLKVKIVIGVTPPLELCMAAFHAGLQVCDVQHGNPFGSPYYAKLNYYASQGSPLINTFFCFDTVSQKAYNQFLTYNNELIVLNASFPVTSESKTSLIQKQGSSRSSIIIALDWMPHIDDSLPGRIEYGLTDGLLNFLNESTEFDFLIRLHPVTTRSRSQSLRAIRFLTSRFSAIQPTLIKYASNTSLESLFQSALAVISYSSGLLFESAQSYVPSLFLSPDSLNFVDNSSDSYLYSIPCATKQELMSFALRCSDQQSSSLRVDSFQKEANCNQVAITINKMLSNCA